MCKSINPCCCISSPMGCGFVAVLDIMIGGLTLFLSGNAIYNFKDAREYLERKAIADDVAWFGVISIPFVALIGLWSGFKLIFKICQCTKNTEEPCHIFKFLVFFITEVIGFVAPFFVFEHYLSKIKALTSWSDAFVIFHLLEVNAITLSLFAYQIFSFWVVHRHHLLKKEEVRNARRPKPKVTTLVQATSSNQQRNQMRVRGPENRHPTNLNGNGSVVYPNLNELMLELLPSPNYRKVDHSVVDVSWTDYDSEADDNSTLNPRVQKPGTRTEFQLRKQQYFQTETLFEDTDFPPNNRSLGSGRHLQWKRPHEINKNSRFFTDGYKRFDVRQGLLGDCWFLAAVANLTLNDSIFVNVVPLDNEWADGGLYCGMCHFRFWVNGNWQEVTIDDRLPTQNGKLIYLQSSDKTEFWSALLEKAYAKLNGSYANLSGNDGIGRAMTSLTGGKVSRHYLHEYENNLDKLFDLMSRALEKGKMLGCCSQQFQRGGIPDHHAYSITHVKLIPLTTGKKVQCIRIRNPWGNKTEWSGNFSDGHNIWDLVDKKLRTELQVIFESDGEFWFPLKELSNYFRMVEICHLP